METYLVVFGGAVAVAAIAAWVYGSRGATRRVHKEKYERLRKEGHSESECLFLLLSNRPGWGHLPEPFLRELSARLGCWENIADFIHLSEREMAEREAYPTIAKSDPLLERPDEVMPAVVYALTRHRPHREKAALFDSLIAPEGQHRYSSDDLVSVFQVSDAAMDVIGDYGATLEALSEEGYTLLYPLSRLPHPEAVIRDALNEAQKKALPGKLADSVAVGLQCLDYFVADEEIPADMTTDEGLEKTLALVQRQADLHRR